jgi:hypothetical protein
VKHLAARLFSRSRSLALSAVVASVIVAAVGAASTSGDQPRRTEPSAEQPEALSRAPRPTDRMTQAFVWTVGGRVIASRRVAAYTDRRHRRWLVWVARTADREICLVWGVSRGETRSGCSPSGRLFRGRALVYSIADGMLAGLATRRVARVDVDEADGGTKHIRPTADGAFILECPQEGRGCGLSAIVARDRSDRILGRFISVP